MNVIGMLWQLVSSFPEFFDSPLNRFAVEIADPQPGEHCLDIGAGVGPAALVAAQRGARVTALEPSGFMRSGLALRNWIANGPIEVLKGPVEAIPLHDDSVDVAVAVNSFHHWENQLAGLSELFRVLTPGGRLYIFEEEFASADHTMHEAMSRFCGSHMDMAVDHAQAKDDLAGAGFTSVDIRTETVDGEPVVILSARA